ncbi:MAG: hypothetical protein ABSG57_13075 [Candidatus Bathyarchaeia archaeon]
MSDKTQTQIPPAKKRVSLKAFINENDKLLTAVGVMGALAALFTQLKDAEFLSFFAFILLLLIDWELWTSFPKSEEASLTLTIFEMFSQFFLFGIGAYLFIAYETFVLLLLPLILFGIFAGIFVLLNRRLKIYDYVRRIAPEGERYSSLVRGLVAVGIMALIAVLAGVITNIVIRLIR